MHCASTLKPSELIDEREHVIVTYHDISHHITVSPGHKRSIPAIQYLQHVHNVNDRRRNIPRSITDSHHGPNRCIWIDIPRFACSAQAGRSILALKLIGEEVAARLRARIMHYVRSCSILQSVDGTRALTETSPEINFWPDAP